MAFYFQQIARMTDIKKEELKRNLTAGITLANLVVLLSLGWYAAQWQQRVDLHIVNSGIRDEELSKKIKTHVEDADKHMPLQTKNILFVTRAEWNIQVKSFEDILIRIDKNVDNLNRKIDNK